MLTGGARSAPDNGATRPRVSGVVAFACLSWPARLFATVLFVCASALPAISAYAAVYPPAAGTVGAFLERRPLVVAGLVLAVAGSALLAFERPHSCRVRAYLLQLRERSAREYAAYLGALGRRYPQYKEHCHEASPPPS